ncbi:hypothetical protein AaE_005806 [Aphanomyces astaci]|uniref:Uncharacterized protein n=1 Tax=Aphanomyces astaci TaxID=112090 RepID=A0A6A5AJM5_APHAT|nr:hypothetical protein AaE_005806 [Aphanomyces astaci]
MSLQPHQLHGDGYDYHYGDTAQMASSMYGGGEEWTEMVHVSAPATTTGEDVTVGAIAFDLCHEMLWVGYSNGRLTSHLLPTLDKYTSVVSNPGPIKQLVPTYEYMNVLSSS